MSRASTRGGVQAMNHESNINLWLGNIVSAGAVVSTVLGWAPAIAAIVALIWYLIQIYESETARRWMDGRRHRKIARLKARVLMMEARAKTALPPPHEVGG